MNIIDALYHEFDFWYEMAMAARALDCVDDYRKAFDQMLKLDRILNVLEGE